MGAPIHSCRLAQWRIGSVFVGLVAALALAACGGGGGGDVGGGTSQQFTVGGTVIGLTGAGLVLQLNGGNDLAVNANGSFTFAARLQEGIGYAVIVRTQPTNPDQFCSVGKGSGQIRADVTDVIVNCSAVQALFPRNGANWSQWILNDGANRNPLLASDQPCTIDSGRSGPDKCLHAGEWRTWNSQRAISCAGLTIRDTLDVFDWMCTQSGQGTAVFTSTGLKAGRKLSDLIDFAALAWRDNRIEISGTQTFESPAGKWWSNPVVAFNGGGILFPGSIHVVTTNAQAAFSMRDGAALVVQPGRSVKAPASASRVVEGSIVGIGVWIEGEFDATGATHGIYLQGFVTSVLRGVRVFNASGTGIEAGGSSSIVLDEVQAVNNGGHGIVMGAGFKLTNSSAYHNAFDGVAAASSWNVSGRSWVDRVIVAHNGGVGLRVIGNEIVVANITAANNGSTGIVLGGPNFGVHNNVAFGLLAVNNGWFGIEVTALSVANSLADIAATGNRFEGLRVNSSGHRLTGTIKLGSFADCGNFIAGCVNAGTSDATFVIGSGIADALVGKVAVDDPVNASDTNGAALLAAISDWTHFANPQRGWGADGNAFPDETNRGLCASGATCRIWDWSLTSVDTVLRAALATPAGNDAIVHRWTPTTQAACDEITGASWIAATTSCQSMFLRRAVELLGIGAGNDNGLCESNEVCMVTANFGAYQGHGELASGGPFTSGQIDGVGLRRFDTNGR
jgi:hypothetical protein